MSKGEKIVAALIVIGLVWTNIADKPSNTTTAPIEKTERKVSQSVNVEHNSDLNKYTLDHLYGSKENGEFFWAYGTKGEKAVTMAIDENGKEKFKLKSYSLSPVSVFRDGIAGVQDTGTSEIYIYNEKGKDISSRFVQGGEVIFYTGEDDTGATVFTCEEYNTYHTHGFKIRAKDADGKIKAEWDTADLDREILEWCENSEWYESSSTEDYTPFATTSIEDLKNLFRYVGGNSYRFSSDYSEWKTYDMDNRLTFVDHVLNVKTGMTMIVKDMLTNPIVTASGNYILCNLGGTAIVYDEYGNIIYEAYHQQESEPDLSLNEDVVLGDNLYYGKGATFGNINDKYLKDVYGNLVADLHEYNITNTPNFEGGYAAVGITNDAGVEYFTLYDTKGNQCFSPVEGIIGNNFMEEIGLYSFIKGGKYLYIDSEGNIKDMPEGFDSQMAFYKAREGRLYCVKDGKLAIAELHIQ